MSAREYIEARSVPVPHCGCWLWLLSIGTHGYGNARWEGRNTTAPRIALEARVGPIPDGLHALHSCDSKWCVNPDHLSPGTRQQNTRDARDRGLMAKKLTPEIVRSIRARHVAREAIRALAREHGVAQRLVQQIVRGKIWGHV